MSREQDELERAIRLSESSVKEEDRCRDLTPDVFEADGYTLYFVNGNYYPVNTQDTLYVANIIKGKNRTSVEMVSLVVGMATEEKYKQRDQVIAILKALYLWQD